MRGVEGPPGLQSRTCSGDCRSSSASSLTMLSALVLSGPSSAKVLPLCSSCRRRGRGGGMRSVQAKRFCSRTIQGVLLHQGEQGEGERLFGRQCRILRWPVAHHED